MMTVIIQNFDTRKELTRFQCRTFYDLNVLRYKLSKLQQENNVLSLGYACVVSDLGITSYARRGNVWGNMLPATVPYREPGNLIVWHNDEEVDTGIRLGFVAYPEGYVLNIGKTAIGILGAKSQMYIASIGKRNVTHRPISDCHIFPSLTHLAKYIRKHETALRYLVSHHGCHFSVEYANDLFRDTVEFDSDEDPLQEVNDLLKQINGEPEKEDDTPIPENPSEDDIRDEVLYRMRKLDLWVRVVNDFAESGKIYQSEAGGIIYDLNKDALQAVEEAKAAVACLPYHVIVTHTTIGAMYTVLYVSKDSVEWPHERIHADGTTLAYVYNADYPDCSELGYVQVQAANGGLVRIS